MTFRKYAQTDEQEESLGALDAAAKTTGFRLSFGTTIGNSPQTVILDHTHQDSLVYVNRDGVIEIDDVQVDTDDLVEHLNTL